MSPVCTGCAVDMPLAETHHPRNANIASTFIWFTKQSYNKGSKREGQNYSDYEFREENTVKIKLIDCLRS